MVHYFVDLKNFQINRLVLCRYGWLEIAERLLDKRNVRMINLQNNQGKTPLHYACHEGHAQIAQLLLMEGATIERSVDSNFFLCMFYLDPVQPYILQVKFIFKLILF